MEDESDLYGPSDVPAKVEEPEMTVDGVTSSVESMMDAGKGTQWLCLSFASGLFEVCLFLRSLSSLFLFLLRSSAAASKLTSLFWSSISQIRSLPNLALMFSVDSLGRFPTVLSDETEEVETIDEDAPTTSPSLHQLIIAPVGVHSPRPHLFVRLKIPLAPLSFLLVSKLTHLLFFPSPSSSSPLSAN